MLPTNARSQLDPLIPHHRHPSAGRRPLVPRLNSGGSLHVTRPSVAHHTTTPEELRARTSDLGTWIAAGELHLQIGRTVSLEQAPHVFTTRESRRTTGKLLLTHRPGPAHVMDRTPALVTARREPRNRPDPSPFGQNP